MRGSAGLGSGMLLVPQASEPVLSPAASSVGGAPDSATAAAAAAMQQQGLEAAAAQVALLGDRDQLLEGAPEVQQQQYNSYQVTPVGVHAQAVQGEAATVQTVLPARIQQHLQQLPPAAPSPLVPPTPEQMQMHYIANRYMADLQQQAQARRGGAGAAGSVAAAPAAVAAPVRVAAAAARQQPQRSQQAAGSGRSGGVSESDIHLQPGAGYK
jgi:hypothetical protein